LFAGWGLILGRNYWYNPTAGIISHWAQQGQHSTWRHRESLLRKGWMASGLHGLMVAAGIYFGKKVQPRSSPIFGNSDFPAGIVFSK